VEARTNAAAETAVVKIDRISHEIGARAGAAVEAAAMMIGKASQDIESRTQVAAETAVGRLGTAAQDMETRAVAASEEVSQRVANVTQYIGARVAEAANALADRAYGATQDIEARTTAATEFLSTRIGAIAGDIEVKSRTAADLLQARAADIAGSLKVNTSDASRMLIELSGSTAEALRAASSDVERTLVTLSSGTTAMLKQSAAEVERSLLGVSGEVTKGFVGKADEITGAMRQNSTELARLLDDKSSGLITAIATKGGQFSVEIERAAESAVKAIDTRAFAFGQTMMDNSTELARIINDASTTATAIVNRTIKDLQDTTKSSVAQATMAVSQTLKDLQHNTVGAVEQSKQTAVATVSELMETHGMLRSDTTALFERLREANNLLQEVLGGAQTNLSSIEQVLSARVAEFVSTMGELLERANSTSGKMDEHVGSFYGLTSKVLGDLGELAVQFEGHGRSLTESVDMLEKSNKHSMAAVTDRHATIESLVSTLNERTEDLDARLKRFSGMLDESLHVAEDRARDIARLVAEATSEGARSIAEQHATIRATTEEQSRRTLDSLRSVYEQVTNDSKGLFQDTATEAHQLLQQATDRFSDVMQTMKLMSTEMQRELETTRQELRRGVLELPEETAESTAQMRRVIVDQMEALAELNRIVARHGRNLDTVPTAATRQEPARPVAQRAEMAVPAPLSAAATRTRVEAPSVQPTGSNGPQNGAAGPNGAGPGRGGWLSELLTRASRDEEDAPRAEERATFSPSRQEERPPRSDDRNARHTIESLDSLSVDIARMIDHDAAAELWDRYNRGERNVFTRRLYTMQGQKAFEEVRRRYKSDREFRQTVDRYIGEFERLLNEVARDDRGQVVARTYLTSETGKVYTMLAHAAGRFD